MTTRKKIAAWTAALCLIAFVALAANPSFSDFITTQFATTTGNKVTIKSGATVTNVAMVGTWSGSVTFSGNNQFSAQTTFTAPPVIAAGLSVAGSLTNLALTASTLVEADANSVLGSVANGTGVLRDNGSGTLTWDNTVLTAAPLPSWGTNGVAAGAVFPTLTNGVYSLTNAAGAIGFTSVSGVDPNLTHDSWGVMMIDPAGSDRTLTLPANWRVADGVRTITVTNGVIGVLSVNVYAGPSATKSYTNATYHPYF